MNLEDIEKPSLSDIDIHNKLIGKTNVKLQGVRKLFSVYLKTTGILCSH